MKTLVRYIKKKLINLFHRYLMYKLKMNTTTIYDILLDQTRYIGCEDLLIKVMQSYLHYGEDNDITIKATYDMAGWLYDNKRYEEVIPILLYLLNFYKNKFGFLNDEYLKILNRLTFSVFIFDNDNNIVENMFTNELIFRVLKDGYYNCNTINCMFELANYYKYKKNYINAKSMFKNTINISEKVLGPNHPLTRIIKEDYVAL